MTGSGSSDEAADGWEETVATTGFAAAAPDIAAAVWMSAAADQVVILKYLHSVESSMATIVGS